MCSEELSRYEQEHAQFLLKVIRGFPMHYKATKNDSVIGPTPHDPIYSGISCFSLYYKAQSLCLLPIAIFGLLKIFQDGPYHNQSYTWPVCNARLPELCRTAVFFREMSLSD